MKTLAALLLAISILGGCQTAPVKNECVCPPVQILLNTEAGLLYFEPGELDTEQDYILKGEQVDEYIKLLQIEILKQAGKGA